MPVFVNDFEISDHAVHQEMQYHPAPSVDLARIEAARSLVIRRLLLEEAAAQGFVSGDKLSQLPDETVETVIESLLDDVIEIPDADEATCKRYHHNNQSAFTDKETGKLLPYESVEDHIRLYLEEKAYHGAFVAFMEKLAGQAKIVGVQL